MLKKSIYRITINESYSFHVTADSAGEAETEGRKYYSQNSKLTGDIKKMSMTPVVITENIVNLQQSSSIEDMSLLDALCIIEGGFSGEDEEALYRKAINVIDKNARTIKNKHIHNI